MALSFKSPQELIHISSVISDTLQQLPRANDSLFEIHTPSMLQSRLDRLKVSMDLLNRTAAGNDGWDAIYSEFQTYYNPDKYGWFKSSDADWNDLARREAELESWKTQLRQNNVKIIEPGRGKLPGNILDTDNFPSTFGTINNLLTAAGIGLAVFLGFKLVGMTNKTKVNGE